MQTYLLAGIAAIAAAAPAAARNGSPYVGIEAGVLFGRSNDIDEFADYTTIQSPAAPSAPAGPADVEFDDVFKVHYQKGYDVDAIAGYDFGFFRVELELGHKRAGLGNIVPDDSFTSSIASLNAYLNRPSAAPDPDAPGLPALTAGSFDLDGRLGVLSGMINGLVEIGDDDGFTLYGGGGYGRARAKALNDRDSAWAWQWIVGVRYAIGRNVDLGIKYRYFDSGILALRDGGAALAGNPNRLTISSPGSAATTVDQSTGVLLVPEIEGRFRSRSLLASLTFNFRGPERPPPQ